MLGGEPVQRTGGEPLAWALESLKAERPLPVQGPLEGLLPPWPHPVFQLEDQCWVQGASHQMWGGRVAGQGPKTSVKWSCFRNRSPFTPSPVILFSLLCQRRQPWGKEPAGPPARPPLVPVGLCMGPAGQSSPCTHTFFLPVPSLRSSSHGSRLSSAQACRNRVPTEGIEKQSLFELYTRTFSAAGYKPCEVMMLKNGLE